MHSSKLTPFLTRNVTLYHGLASNAQSAAAQVRIARSEAIFRAAAGFAPPTGSRTEATF